MRYFLNPHLERGPYRAEEARIVSLALTHEALTEMATWPGYTASPLVSLQRLARKLGTSEILYKDESGRFGLGSFKALGGTYGAARALQARLHSQFAIDATLTQMDSGRYAKELATFTICSATDGNHGRAVAFGARRYGCPCVIFIHEDAPESKATAISALGAKVQRVKGTYDDAVLAARQAVKANGWLSVSDTSDLEFEETPARVMQGYTVMALEILNKLGRAAPPTHIFLQGGVGALAGAITGSFCEAFAERAPKIIVVEPQTAACLLESAIHGEPITIDGDLKTAMGGLSCGRPSSVAWQILKRRANAFMAIPDEAAATAADLLKGSNAGGPQILAGPSGVAGLAGLVEALGDADLRARLELGQDSRVLLFGTEGTHA